MRILNIENIEQITNKIILIEFQDTQTMVDTLIRPQVYYEDIDFYHKIFNLEEYKRHYTEKYGVFDYRHVVLGCHINSHSLEPLLNGDFGELTDLETQFLDIVKYIPKPYSIIATGKNSSLSDLDHEICHGLYGTDSNYKNNVNKLIKLFPKRILNKVGKILSEMYYHKAVHFDELNAYLVTGTKNHFDDIIFPEDIVKNLIKLKVRYFKKYNIGV